MALAAYGRWIFHHFLGSYHFLDALILTLHISAELFDIYRTYFASEEETAPYQSAYRHFINSVFSAKNGWYCFHTIPKTALLFKLRSLCCFAL